MREGVVMREGVIQHNSIVCVLNLLFIHYCLFLSAVDLAIISYSQSTRAVDNTATVVNSFECQVQYGSTPDKGKPDATWYINNVPLHSVPGSGRFTEYGLSTTSVDGVNNTARSILSVNNGLVQDSGVYECRFDWIGYSVSHQFYFAIIGRCCGRSLTFFCSHASFFIYTQSTLIAIHFSLCFWPPQISLFLPSPSPLPSLLSSPSSSPLPSLLSSPSSSPLPSLLSSISSSDPLSPPPPPPQASQLSASWPALKVISTSMSAYTLAPFTSHGSCSFVSQTQPPLQWHHRSRWMGLTPPHPYIWCPHPSCPPRFRPTQWLWLWWWETPQDLIAVRSPQMVRRACGAGEEVGKRSEEWGLGRRCMGG